MSGSRVPEVAGRWLAGIRLGLGSAVVVAAMADRGVAMSASDSGSTSTHLIFIVGADSLS